MATDRTAAAELTRRTRREQGLPPKVEDPAVLAAIATIIERGNPKAGAA